MTINNNSNGDDKNINPNKISPLGNSGIKRPISPSNFNLNRNTKPNLNINRENKSNNGVLNKAPNFNNSSKIENDINNNTKKEVNPNHLNTRKPMSMANVSAKMNSMIGNKEVKKEINETINQVEEKKDIENNIKKEESIKETNISNNTINNDKKKKIDFSINNGIKAKKPIPLKKDNVEGLKTNSKIVDFKKDSEETDKKENSENKKTDFQIPKSKDPFQGKVAEYNSLLEKTKNKNIANKLLKKKELNIDDRIKLLKDFVKAEDEIEKIKNPNLQNFLLEKIENDEKLVENKNISDFVSEIKSDYLVANTIKPRIALGKVIEQKLEDDEPIPLETQNQITDIFNVPQELANDLGLDLGLLKTDLTVKLQEEIDGLKSNKNLIQKKAELEQKIKTNQALAKKKEVFENKQKELDLLIQKEEDPEKRQKFMDQKQQLGILIANNEKEYKDNLKKNKLAVVELKELELEQGLKQKDIERIQKNLEDIKNIEINNDDVKISDEVKKVIIEEYNNESEKIEEKYRHKIENENKIKVESIKEKVLKNDIDPEKEKKILEDMYIQEEKKKKEKYKQLEEKEIELEIERELANDFNMDSDVSSEERNQKLYQAGKAGLNELFGKVKIEKEKLKLEGKDNFDPQELRKERELKKKIKLANSNIQSKIDKINNDFSEYKKNGDYDPKKVEEFEEKIAGFQDLKDKLNDKSISSAEKQGLLALLGKGDWLKNYIKVRQDNYLYDAKGFSEKLTELHDVPFEKVEPDEYTSLYEKYLSSEKYSLIEEFSKLRAEIPNFEKVSITDDLEKIASKLGGFNDDELLQKFGKLKKIQEQILHFNAEYTKEPIIDELYVKRKAEEITLQRLREDIDRDNKKIDLLDVSDAEKQGMKLHNEEIFNKKAAKVKENIEKIDNQISKIEEIAKTDGKFSKDEIKDISKNIDLFSVVGNYNKYGNIVDGIYEDILDGNTDFIDLESYKNIKADFYTTSKLNELSQKEILSIKSSLENIPDNASPAVKKYKRVLVQELRKTEELKENIDKGRILEEGVIDYFKDENLYKIKLHENIKEILEQLNNPELGDNEKEELKKELSKNFVKLEKIEENDIGESLSNEIHNGVKDFEIDKELINTELEDGFKNANTAKKTLLSSYTGKFENLMDEAKDRWANIGHEATMTAKVVANELKNGKSIFEEDQKEIKDRHKKIDKYVHAILLTGISGFFLILPRFLNGLSSTIAKFPIFLDFIRKFVEKNKSHIFILTLILVGIIVIITPQSSFNFLNLNTHLYSILNYTTEAGNFQFSDTLGEKGEILYYKLNTYLFFIFLIVLYNMIIEFLHKYIQILKKPKVGIDLFMWSLAKLVIFFIYLTIIFKVNTFIG